MVRGKVYFVGGGPGDPELLTLRAARLLATAQVVVYDEALEALLPLAKGATVKVPAQALGKGREVAKALVDYVNEYHVVVRLKSGDPLIYSRFFEEAAYLEEVGVEFEVVPGVSSVTAALGLVHEPLTTRGEPILIMSGHEANPGLCGVLRGACALVLMPSRICDIVKECAVSDHIAILLERIGLPGQGIRVLRAGDLCFEKLKKPAIVLLKPRHLTKANTRQRPSFNSLKTPQDPT